MDGGGLKTNYFTQTDVQLKFMFKTLSQQIIDSLP